MSRLIYGALAGIAGTVAMTAVMRRLHKRLPREEQYSLPPREIFEGLRRVEEREDRVARATMLGHFGYGALTGGVFAAQRRRGVPAGSAYGLAVWGASYLGWIPTAAILSPAYRHPARRNALMLTAHAAWGAVLVLALREIEAAEAGAFRRTAVPAMPDVAPVRHDG